MSFKRKKRYAFIAYILCLAFMFTLMPMGVAWADDVEVRIDEIQLLKTYDGIDNVDNYFIYLRGKDLSHVTVWREKTTGGWVELRCNYPSNSYLEFTIPSTSPGERDVTVNKIRIDTPDDSVVIQIAEDDMPRINTLNPTKVKIEDGPLVIEGENFQNIGADAGKVIVKYFRGTTEVDITNNKILDGTGINVPKVSGALGDQNIYFERKSNLALEELNTKPVLLRVEYRHLGIFRIYEDLDISKDIEMYPNRGPKKTKVYFQADKLQKDMSVFFLKAGDGSDVFKQSNKGKYINFLFKTTEEEKDVFIVEVPDLPIGEYEVYLTNEIKDDELPEYAVTRERRLGQIFTVIESSSQGEIISLTPKRGPDGGMKNVTIQAKNIASISKNVFIPGLDSKLAVEVVNEDELIIEYDKGRYKEFKKDLDAKLVRSIKFIIGNSVTFNEADKQIISPEGLDNISVNIPQIDLVDKDTLVDVTAIIRSTITYKEGDVETSLTFIEEVIKKDGFTFYPSSIDPIIEKVTPDKIMVDQGMNVTEDRMVAIYGKDFLIHRYEESGTDIVRYPVIKLGSLEIDKNKYPDLEVLVMDSFNNVLDGSSGREIGSKILVIIPGGSNVYELGMANVVVTNPMRESMEMGRSTTAYDMIEFVLDAEKPYITTVSPDTVTVGGGEEVTIEGSNFRPGVQVFIDGNEVKNIDRDGTGSEITFKAPPGRAGTTQLQVMNSDGGIVVWPFTYVTTYTDPKITDFNPKKGSYDTLVVVKGKNFLRPDPTALSNETLKLVGTRILLENEDINRYHLDSYNRIALQDYTSPTANLLINPDNGQLADYYHSITLEENSANPANYYVLRDDPNGTIRLTNGREDSYTIGKSDGTLKAVSQVGKTYNVEVKADYIELQGDNTLKLNIKTPYYINTDNKTITGNRLKVINNEEIHFAVPSLQEGYHDLTVINPDTKRDSRLGNQGFYYYVQPDSDPKITDITPSEGSVKGGYTIDIKGKDFRDDGQKKVGVTIGGTSISPQDTVVSTDGTKITVIVPPYPGDLRKDKGTGRWAVPVVLVNPDGGSASEPKGFTYVVPSSSPEIIKLEPAQGSAAGNDIVEIIGRDFRFFEPYEDRNNNREWDEGEPFTDTNSNDKWDDYRNKTVEQLKSELGEDYEDLVVPILPKVHFGDKLAEVLEFSTGYLKVKTPPAKTGNVEVYIVNNDAGVSPKVSFTYEGSNPKITKLVPDQGSRFGRDNVEIIGEGFFANNIQVYSTSKTNTTKVTMPLLRFGKIQGLNRIDNQRTTVTLDGGLELNYDASTPENKKVTIRLKEGNETYATTIENYDDTVKFVNLGLLRSNVGDTIKEYPGYELIRLEVENRRLKVERGYSPKVVLERINQLIVTTPSYYAVGKVPVTIFNPDGGTATGQFEYKNPDSRPQITDITRDTRSSVNTLIAGKQIKVLKINYQGKSRVAIFGSDFRAGAKIQVGSLLTIDPKDITYELPSKLSFEMPDVPESALDELHRVIVMNIDGASASSDSLEPPIMLQFTQGETEPKITKVTPILGPTVGGTLINIEGEDFRPAMEGYEGNSPQVYFGEQPANQVEVVDYKTIQAVSPINNAGNILIRIENPDGSISTPGGDFNYISNPKVTAVINATDPTETTRIRSISVEGGQEIKLKGIGFMEGLKVIF
ncbi:MAG TPA: IPT/TIG domain-containing protein, partial [Syntrophomonadaceae bacterium]|nr:IPT/TIG domain-containing protein [Syntrophomonadaceae bacterium]